MVACTPDIELRAGMKIYGLIDPETGFLRYVGQTTKSIKERFSRHIYTATYEKRKTHCYDWIRSLLKRGLRPQVWVIQTGLLDKNELDFAERAWIKYFRETQGLPLTNHTDGAATGVYDERTRRKISESKTGSKHSQETRQRMSEAHRGENNSFYGRTHSEETCRRISEANKGGTNQNTFKTHCKWGHEFTPENTFLRSNGARDCLTCKRRRGREGMCRYREKLKGRG